MLEIYISKSLVYRTPRVNGPHAPYEHILRMDLEICDSKSEFGTKTENSDFRKLENFSLGVQNRLLRLLPSPESFLNIF